MLGSGASCMRIKIEWMRIKVVDNGTYFLVNEHGTIITNECTHVVMAKIHFLCINILVLGLSYFSTIKRMDSFVEQGYSNGLLGFSLRNDPMTQKDSICLLVLGEFSLPKTNNRWGCTTDPSLCIFHFIWSIGDLCNENTIRMWKYGAYLQK